MFLKPLLYIFLNFNAGVVIAKLEKIEQNQQAHNKIIMDRVDQLFNIVVNYVHQSDGNVTEDLYKQAKQLVKAHCQLPIDSLQKILPLNEALSDVKFSAALVCY